MGQLAFVGSHSINGVSALHTDLMKQTVFADLNKLYPGPHQQQDQRHHAAALADAVQSGADQADQRAHRRRSSTMHRPDRRARTHADDPTFQEQFAAVKRANKVELANLIKDRQRACGRSPDALFDVQIKRIHEYKRQLLNIIEAVAQY
jgi:starch phosphorylase